MTVAEPVVAQEPVAPSKATSGGRWIAIAAVAAWSVVLLSGLLFAAAVQWLGDLGCEAQQGDSNFGTSGWSVVPPGPTCTYTEELNGFSRVDGPTPVMSIWLIVLVLGGVGCILLARRARRA